MMPTWWFPMLIIGLDVFAALAYAIAWDWKRALYWMFAAGLTGCITA